MSDGVIAPSTSEGFNNVKKYANGIMIFKFLPVLALFPPIMKPITIEFNCLSQKT
jgi:hypothetical protein